MIDGNETLPSGGDGTFSTGCSDHGLPHCLCDVQPLSAGVPIKSVPFAERLLELGLSRPSFVTWAEEVSAWLESQTLSLVAEA